MTTSGKPDATKPGNDTPKDEASRSQNEGEGSRTAAKAYNDAAHRFVDAGKVPDAAREAEKALSSSEHEAMVAAEAKGKSRARH